MKYSLRNPIVATLAYYDIFDFPLTLFEIDKYLIHPSRFTRHSDASKKHSLEDLLKELDDLIISRVISEKNGFYTLSGRQELWAVRVEREKIAAQKWKRFLRLSRKLAWIPFLQSFMASGSLAIENTVPQSDYDVFVVTSANRLYSCRLFLWLATSLMGVRRGRFDKVAPDKLCFNHYVSETGLAIEYHSLYTAQVYSSLQPVLDTKKVMDRFYEENIWLSEYLVNIRNDQHDRVIYPGWLSKLFRSILETILWGSIGNLFENICRKYQQRRIADNPMTYESRGRVIFTDRVLEFHPRSFEAIVIERYNAALRRLGVVPLVPETDSGLSQ